MPETEPISEIEPAEEDIIQQPVEETGASEGVSALDPDFLAMLGFALLMDGLDLILVLLELVTAFTIGWLLSIALDAFILAIIGSWMFFRMQRITQSKRQRVESMKAIVAKRTAALKTPATKGIASPLRRVSVRAGVALVGEILPIIGVIPFWTISVVSMLREK